MQEDDEPEDSVHQMKRATKDKADEAAEKMYWSLVMAFDRSKYPARDRLCVMISGPISAGL